MILKYHYGMNLVPEFGWVGWKNDGVESLQGQKILIMELVVSDCYYI